MPFQRDTVRRFVFWVVLFPLLLVACSEEMPQARCQQGNARTQAKHALSCYLAETVPQELKLLDTQTVPEGTIYHYSLVSQTWPMQTHSGAKHVWVHRLTMYVPSQISGQQALLIVSDGTRNSVANDQAVNPELNLDYFALAKAAHSAVVVLKDVPNQYLTFDDGVARKEDGIVAYSWNRYLDDAVQGQYWPAHLPMAKAVVQAMDAVQRIAPQRGVTIDQFVLTGLSKRAWAVWLASVADDRVAGLIPMVGDVPATRRLIDHIYQSYDQSWPPAFHDYVEQGVVDRLHEPAFDHLMRIEDPLLYLSDVNVKRRLRIPKYIVSVSGDDFFTPDAARLYRDQLPGVNVLRVIPNQSHYLASDKVQESIQMYYQLAKRGWQNVPSVIGRTRHAALYQVDISELPEKVTLWRAHNPVKRDFRFSAGIQYQPVTLTGQCSTDGCIYPVPASKQGDGWVATFVEAQFKTGAQASSLILTTPVYITPNRYAGERPTPFPD